MAIRVGIELSPAACRIVGIDPGRTRRGQPALTHVTSFASLPAPSDEAAAALESLRGQRVAVVLWGVGADHRKVVVDHGSLDRMSAQARAVRRDTGGPTRGTLADILPMSSRPPGTSRRGVLIATASAREVEAALRPLADAGVKVGAVLTPAAALLSLARMRRSLVSPGALEMYVALEESATCAALVRDGKLLAARDLPWGFMSESAGHQALRAREDIAARLAEDVSAFVLAAQVDGPLTQICICGGLPDLRSMTIPLMQQLDVEVETLDSLFAIDETRLPGPAGEFRERSAELRLAWAAAADPRPPIDLFRERRRRRTRALLARAAVVAGIAAGLGVGWVVQNRWPAISSARAARPSPSEASEPNRPTPVITRAPSPSAPPRGSAGNPPAPAGRQWVEARGGAVAGAGRTAPIPSVDAEASIQSGTGRGSSAGGVGPIQPLDETPRSGRGPGTGISAGGVPIQPVGRARQPGDGSAPIKPVGGATASAAAPRPVEEPAVPFEAVLGTILYAPDRKLAIIDGRIVQEGDEVRGARVVQIAPAMVLLRDARGRLRSLTVAGAAR